MFLLRGNEGFKCYVKYQHSVHILSPCFHISFLPAFPSTVGQKSIQFNPIFQYSQSDMERQVNSRIDSMEKQVNSRVDKLRGSMEKTMAENQDVVRKEIEKATKDMMANLDTEVGILCARMEKMEQKISEREAKRKSFDPDVFLIVVGLPQSEGEDLMA